VDLDVILCGIGLGVGLFLLVLPRTVHRLPRLRQWCDEAGLAGVPLTIVGIVLGTVSVIVATAVTAIIPIPAVTPLGVALGLGVPLIALSSVRDSRRLRARTLWPDVIDSIRVSLRSGSTLLESVSAAATMVPGDWRMAWDGLESDLRRGSDAESALRRLQHVLADPVADRVVESFAVAREFGGTELPAVLSELARSVRKEQGIRDEARTRQSWVRHAATLGVIAPWVVLALLASRPENRDAYASSSGSVLIIASAGATVVAYFVMTALGSLREPRRWLTGGLDG
jgi:tight adherence protein B